VLHRHMRAAPEPFLQALVPSREDLGVGVACLFTWSWLADLCTQEGIPCVLGHALSMKAMPGGQAKHERSDAHTMAVRLRGGMLPQASVDPAERRATRDVLRRRMPLTRTRAERLAQLQHTHRQSNLPAIRKQLASKATRAGVAERCPEPAVQQRLAVALALIKTDDHWLTDLERSLVKTTNAHDAQLFSRLRSIPGVGTILALVRLDALHALHRFPRLQACVSSGRRVTGAKASAGKRDGTSGQKLGHASLTWAFAAAAVLFLRHHPAGQQSLARLTKQHGKGHALTGLAHPLARAV
jgi:Transposase IS116/IS110/IS902 family